MTPSYRVQWTEPDHDKQRAARGKFKRDMTDRRHMRESGLEKRLAACHASDRDRVIAELYPDLDAVVVHFGTLLSVRFVPAQYGLSGPDLNSAQRSIKLCDDRWVALVATEHGTAEMDPRKLQVMWQCAPGDPIGGIVSADELSLQAREPSDHRDAMRILATRLAESE